MSHKQHKGLQGQNKASKGMMPDSRLIKKISETPMCELSISCGRVKFILPEKLATKYKEFLKTSIDEIPGVTHFDYMMFCNDLDNYQWGSASIVYFYYLTND